MKPQDTLQQPTAKDISLLRNTVLKLTAAPKLTAVVVVAVALLVWYVLLKRLVAFGQGIDYSGLHALGAHTVNLLQQYNPFFWWAVVALGTLLIIWLLYGFVQALQKRSRLALVAETVIVRLASELSQPAREVLRWVWHDARYPITVGDLQRTLGELRAGRAAKIVLARRHAALLDAAMASQPGTSDLHGR